MDPIKMLIDDHNKVRNLFREFEAADDRTEQQRIADQVMDELEVHAAIEEEIFYPAMRHKGDAQDKELVAEAYHEHAEAKDLIKQLRGMRAGDEQFADTFRQLRQDIEHHADEEEQEMLPHAREELMGDLDRIGEEMTARKQQLMMAMRTAR